LQPHQFRVVFPNGFGILSSIASSQIITGSFLAIPSWDQMKIEEKVTGYAGRGAFRLSCKYPGRTVTGAFSR
jgi:hypothetical protein